MNVTKELLQKMINAPERYQVLEQNPFEVMYENNELPVILKPELVSDTYNKKMIIFDTETTGLNQSSDEIIELAFVVLTYNLRTYDIVSIDSLYDEFCEPTKEITSKITQVTGITPAMVAGKKITISDIEPYFPQRFLFVAHNAGFDRKFIDRKFPDLKDKPWADTLTEIDWSAKGFKKSNLEALMYGLGAFYTAHRAINDVLALLYVIDKTRSLEELILSASQKSVEVEVNIDYDHKQLVKDCGFRWFAQNKTWKRNYRKMNDWKADKEMMIGRGAKLSIVEMKLISSTERYK